MTSVQQAGARLYQGTLKRYKKSSSSWINACQGQYFWNTLNMGINKAAEKNQTGERSAADRQMEQAMEKQKKQNNKA